MDLSEMLASPPPRPAASRTSGESTDQGQDPAFAAAVDAADAETNGQTNSKQGETVPAKVQDGDVPKDAPVAAAPESKSEEAPVEKAAKGSVASAPRTGPGAETATLPATALTEIAGRSPEQPSSQPMRIVATSSVTAGESPDTVLPAEARKLVQAQVADDASSTETKPRQPLEASVARPTVTTAPASRSVSERKPAETAQTVSDAPELARTAPKAEPTRAPVTAAPARDGDNGARRVSQERAAPREPEFRVTVRNTVPSAAPVEATAKPEPIVNAAPLRADAARSAQRTSRTADRVQAPTLNTEAPAEGPKLNAELKPSPELPGPTRSTIGENLARSTSTVTTIQSFSLAPTQAPQLQTASIPTVVAAEQTPGFVEARLGPQLTAAAGTRSNGGVVEVLLEPPELGRVEIQMELSDQGLRATLSAERQATTDLLRRNLEVLAQQFEDAGFADVDLDFASFGDGQLATDQEDAASGEHALNQDEDASRSQGSRSASTRGHDGLVDMRL